MNARQTKKNLKKQIRRLKSDNELMRRIIEDSHEMQELYYLWNKPLNVQHTSMQFQEVKAQRTMPSYMADLDGYIDHVKMALASDLISGIKKHIVYEVDADRREPIITASIVVGRKE